MNLKDIGKTLKKARQEKSLTLKQISNKTQISLSQLAALEEGDISKLPAPVYIKGFIQSYGKVLNLDTRDMASQFEQKDPVLEVIQIKESHEGFRKSFNLIHVFLSLAIIFFVSLIVFMRSILNKYEEQKEAQERAMIQENPLYIKSLEKRMKKHTLTPPKQKENQ